MVHIATMKNYTYVYRNDDNYMRLKFNRPKNGYMKISRFRIYVCMRTQMIKKEAMNSLNAQLFIPSPNIHGHNCFHPMPGLMYARTCVFKCVCVWDEYALYD